MRRQLYQIETSSWGLRKKGGFARDLLENVFTFLKPGCCILEIGPGLGHFSDACKEHDFGYVAIEPSEKMARSLRDRGHEVITQPVPPIPVEDSSFDFILANHVLEHQPDYVEAMAFLSEIKRVLRRDGYCCLSFPNWLKMKNIFYEMDYSHNFITTQFRVCQMINNAGLKVAKVFRTNGQIKLRSGFISWVIRSPWMLLQAVVNRNFLSVIAEYLNLEGFLCKVRKTVHESIYIVVRES